MRPSVRLSQALRAFRDELGPLVWVALASAVLPTTGLFVLFVHLPEVAACWPAGAAGAAFAFAAIVLATGCMLLPPSVCAFAAGYVFGAPIGSGVALLAIGLGGVVGQRLFWPRLGSRLYAFMRERPRVTAVRTLCRGSLLTQVRGVARLRLAARLPFAIGSLLLSVAAVPSHVVWLGSTLGAVPLAWLGGGVGAAFRDWRERGALPGGFALASLVLAATAGLAGAIAARRAVGGASAAG